ncbi:MAG: amylo-alpha-1,6-glucosidase [Candidatus Latescibacterota bacterium]
MPASIRFDATVTRDFSRASTREWLETNGLGGWASSTVSGAHTRRYHGLLVVATRPPVGRLVMLSKLEETLGLSEGQAELGCSIYPGAVHPQGFRHLVSFALDPFPTSTYAVGEVTVRRTVGMIAGRHMVVVLYELLRAPGPVRLELRPLYAGRDYHHLVQANGAVRQEARFARSILHYQPYPGQPTVRILVPGARYVPSPDWYYNFQYPREEERGLDYAEDLFTCGLLQSTLEPGGVLPVVISTDNLRGVDGRALLEDERRRRARSRVPTPLARHPLAPHLLRAAGQFLARRESGLHAIIAGYHWFTDWGRDTMISLPGICLVPGRYEEARSIFRAYAQSISEGMIPNRFPDYGEQPDYNTVDATLWFFTSVHRYLRYTGDYAFVEKELWAALQDVVLWHRRGTRYGIVVDPADGLLCAGSEGDQLTWMDAKVQDRVITPRHGKAVEICALWYNVLRVVEQLGTRFGERDVATGFAREAERVKDSFVRAFWNPAAGYLFDVVDGSRRDAALRPNQILALSLPFPLLEGQQAERVLAAVDCHLFTPCGLRTLSPADPAYRPRYLGSAWERDSAYHQGTAWGWLLGPFITALVRFRGEEGRQRAERIVAGLEPLLCEAGLGTLSEIHDAEPPHTPRGCVAQAWSVAEVLRALYEDVLGAAPDLTAGGKR